MKTEIIIWALGVVALVLSGFFMAARKLLFVLLKEFFNAAVNRLFGKKTKKKTKRR